MSFADLGDERFVSLTTFRRTGERVATPVWVARDSDALIVSTPEESGKVKRLRNSPRVELRPCGRTGRVREDAEPVAGVAEILTSDDTLERLTRLIRKKYGLEYRIFTGIEGWGRSGRPRRVILRITPA
jgi:PPOX class probable F420-dependent enzyme